MSDIKIITSDAVIVHPETFVFATPTVVTSNVVPKRQVSFDLKLKHLCNHTLSSGQYRLANCPRCLGTGYYYDIKFNDVGKLLEVSIEDKLIQAIEKLTLTEENRFHSEVAMNMQQWLGVLGNKDNLGIIKDKIVSALASLKEIQKVVPRLSPRARIGNIDSLTVDLTVDGTLRYIIKLTTVSGENKTISGTINFSDLIH